MGVSHFVVYIDVKVNKAYTFVKATSQQVQFKQLINYEL